MRLSKTLLTDYQDCPRKAYYERHPGIPKHTDYARLCGVEVHRHIAELHDPTTEPRPFYFKTRKSALGAWFDRWNREAAKATEEGRLLLPNPEIDNKYFRIGARCIVRYWKQNEGLPRPIAVEKRFRTTLRNGDELMGVFDQIRQVSLEYIARHRPELIADGRLADGYDNVVIVDLKTDYEHYDIRDFRTNSTTREEVRWQYELHEGRQATMYTFLYERETGKKPVGFVWYHLRSGKAFFTYREDRDYETLLQIVAHVAENWEAQSFPKNEGRRCRTCDHVEPCRENRRFLLAKAEEVPDAPVNLVLVPNLIRKNPNRQLRLPFKMPRRKHMPPPAPEPTEKELVLRNLPWDTETAEPPRMLIEPRSETHPEGGTQQKP